MEYSVSVKLFLKLLDCPCRAPLKHRVRMGKNAMLLQKSSGYQPSFYYFFSAALHRAQNGHATSIGH
jgi:hypothetical protein